VGDRPDPAAVGVSDLVQDQAFPVVEADPQGPFLPAQLVPVQLERDPFRLGDVQRAHVVAGAVAGDEARYVLAHHLGGSTWPESPMSSSSIRLKSSTDAAR